jgi:hypothetical protein
MGLTPASRKFPLAVKVLYTAFVAVLVPYYWMAYGPTNFLYFCDIALFFTLAALWLESPLLASMPLVGILVPQLLWQVDFLVELAGFELTRTTRYMFDPSLSVFTRGLSFFHFWLPLLLLWMVWRLGYDGRALLGWALLSWAVQLVCYFLMPPPPLPPRVEGQTNPPVNINYVYGLGDDAQTWVHPLAWLAFAMVAMPLVCYVPAHFVLRWAFPRPAR